MNKLARIIYVMFLVITTINTQARIVVAEPEDFMHSNGKIYVVVGVVLTILFGLFFYVINLDRKISKMEKK